MLRSGIQRGRVFHRRMKPRHHCFAYPVFMSLMDVDEVEQIFSRSRWWSIDRFNLISFHRQDYIGSGRSLREEVKLRIADATNQTFDGRVFILTHTRYLGICFNPVTFYFCFEGEAGQPRFILAEINNTPWNERHCYVLENKNVQGDSMDFRFDKQFHVSPFMPMELEYRWRFRLQSDRIEISMALHDGSTVCFEAGLDLTSEPFSATSMRSVPLRYPFMTAAVVFRIYWQAFLLWLKRIPLHDHPKHNSIEPDYEHHC